ncbi:unnamed protein product [Ixodes pacificus]
MLPPWLKATHQLQQQLVPASVPNHMVAPTPSNSAGIPLQDPAAGHSLCPFPAHTTATTTVNLPAGPGTDSRGPILAHVPTDTTVDPAVGLGAHYTPAPAAPMLWRRGARGRYYATERPRNQPRCYRCSQRGHLQANCPGNGRT